MDAQAIIYIYLQWQFHEMRSTNNNLHLPLEMYDIHKIKSFQDIREYL